MVIGVGTDIIEIDRIKKAVQTRPKFIERFFTREEIDYCQTKGDFFGALAARFAAKEAVSKALGTGFRGFKWQEIEIKNNEMGKPYVKLYGEALKIFQSLGANNIQISISHSRDYASAVVVIEGG